MSSLRFNPPKQWNNNFGNSYFLGLTDLMYDLYGTLLNRPNLKMLEIGSYKGESAFMFASLGIFTEIHCIDPLEGVEESNDIFTENWDNVKNEFKLNTRYFDNVTLHQGFSYNLVNNFEDNYFDFIYIDGNHSYEDAKKDIELYLPKAKHLMGGHDYQKEWPGVIKAVDEIFGKPHKTYSDGSWIKSIKP
jgi:hypothetical protein